jgi:hypothetical protein
MKVNISYSVELEEVLKEMESVYNKSAKDLEKKLELCDTVLEYPFDESEVDYLISAMNSTLNAYHRHTSKLKEILRILDGYKSITEATEQALSVQKQTAVASGTPPTTASPTNISTRDEDNDA